MNKLSQAINNAILQCQLSGSCSGIRLYDSNDTCISAEWEEWEVDSGYDVITIYVYQEGGIIKFNYQVEETKILKDKEE
jgi:hypothetical protein